MYGINVILGGDGLIGRALARSLRERGEDTVSLDLKRGFDLRLRVPETFPSNAYYWFLAWDVGGAKYLTDASRQTAILRSNLLLCAKVFGWLADRRARLTFVSTQMVETAGAYGFTKRVGERCARQIPGALICRLWNVYGAERPSLRSHVVPDLVRHGAGGDVRVGTSGEERRQFISDRDCAEALIKQRETGQPVADVTSGEWLPIKDVARVVGELMGARVSVAERRGHESLVEPTWALAGWAPREPLRAGLARTICGMRAAGWA